jgi:hypothetical protein
VRRGDDEKEKEKPLKKRKRKWGCTAHPCKIDTLLHEKVPPGLLSEGCIINLFLCMKKHVLYVAKI